MGRVTWLESVLAIEIIRVLAIGVAFVAFGIIYLAPDSHLDTMPSTPPKTLIIGAGMTGSAVYHALSALKSPLAAQPGAIAVWDKARGYGGRMSVARGPIDGQVADLGARYVTAKDLSAWNAAASPGAKHSAIRDVDADVTRGGGAPAAGRMPAAFRDSVLADLVSSGVLRPFTGSIVGGPPNMVSSSDMVAPSGMSSIVKHLYRNDRGSAGPAAPLFGERVASIELVPRSDQLEPGLEPAAGQVWAVTTENGHRETFDGGVVITVPVPQLLSIKGDVFQSMLQPYRKALEAVTYSSRYGLALFFEESDRPALSHLGLGVASSAPSKDGRGEAWTSKYVAGEPFVRYISMESDKRSGVNDDGLGGSAVAAPPVVLIHTSVKVWEDDLTNEQVEANILEGLERVLQSEATAGSSGRLPPPKSKKLIKWRFSQVFDGVEGAPGALLLTTEKSADVAAPPPLVIAGDAFSSLGSNFDGCLESGYAAAQLLTPMAKY